jgi:hypothetical protein
VFEKLEDQAQVITATAFLDMDDTWDGDTTAGFEDASRIFAQVAGNYNGPPEPGREDVYPDEFAYWMRQFAERLRSGPQWVAQASSSELVAAVQVATTMWHATAVHKLPLGEEDTWRMIAALANAAFSLVELVAEIQSQIMTGPCNTAGVGAHLEA